MRKIKLMPSLSVVFFVLGEAAPLLAYRVLTPEQSQDIIMPATFGCYLLSILSSFVVLVEPKNGQGTRVVAGIFGCLSLACIVLLLAIQWFFKAYPK